MHAITAVEAGSAAGHAGITAGDILLAIDGERVFDIIDYLALTAQKRLTLRVRKASGEELDVGITKRSGADLGLSFSREMMSERRLCANKCAFCFVDQNPRGVRAGLLVKDDDWRESFMMGNYITLTNVSDAEFSRIIKRRVQPLFISVHAYDPVVRVKLMGSRRAEALWERLRALCGANLGFHAQIVLCPDINDGGVLSETLFALGSLSSLGSVALVPVGLTGHRENLAPLKPFDRETARGALARLAAFEREKPGLAFAADELYLLAGEELPPYEAYGDFPQIENGVGLMRMLEREFHESDRPGAGPLTATIVTGEAAAPFLRTLLSGYDGFRNVEVVAAPNLFFGGCVNVAGLVTGGDIVRTLQNRKPERLLIPACMLKDGEIFLDDMTLGELKARLGVPVSVVPVNGEALWNIKAMGRSPI